MSGKFSKIILNGETLMDVTQDTVASNNLLSGETAHGADGETVTGSYSVNLQAKTNVNPSTSSQTVLPDSGYNGLSSVQINAMPSGGIGTPTATKGAVLNHSVSVIPSVTNTTGYITGGTVNGTAVSVSASELVSGTKLITENGTGIDVTDYASVNVAVPSSTPTISSLTVTPTTSQQIFDGLTPILTFSAGRYNYGQSSTDSYYTDLRPTTLVEGNTYEVYGVAQWDEYTVTLSGEWSFNYHGSGVIYTDPIPFTTSHPNLEKIDFSGGISQTLHFYGKPNVALTIITPITFSEKTVDGYLPITVGAINNTTKTITENGTYVAGDDNADGYSSVTVNVPSGGVQAKEKDVNFIDYDGTLLYSYTASEAQALTALPANPSHTGLTAKGWNWTLSEIKSQLTNVPGEKVWVGQMYITTSGATEIDIALDDPEFLSPYIVLCINGTVSVDWGDNSTSDTMTGTNSATPVFQQHTYASIGNYTIKLIVTNGYFTFYSSSSNYSGVLRASTDTTNNRACNSVYNTKVTAIRLGSEANIGNNAFSNCYALQSITIPDGVTIGNGSAFSNCSALQSITIPNGVTNIDGGTFTNCSALRSIAIPNGVTSIGGSAFNYCSALRSITIPDGVTSIASSAFSNCRSLKSITIPDGVTSIASSVLSYCYALQSITIPDGVTSIASSAFSYCYALQSITIPDGVTSIGNSAFSNCRSLKSITIPDGVTNIEGSVFSNCYGTYEYHFLGTTPPTLVAANVFNNIMSGTIIYVPYSADHSILEAYKTATNWSTYASYMQEEPQE